jgi:hypothetical protein
LKGHRQNPNGIEDATSVMQLHRRQTEVVDGKEQADYEQCQYQSPELVVTDVMNYILQQPLSIEASGDNQS